MKSCIKPLAIIPLLALTGAAFAVEKQSSGTDAEVGNSAIQPQKRVMSDKNKWACEVAMCLSNPEGPTAVSECVPPIKKMKRELAKGNSIPKCPFLGNDNNDSSESAGGGGRGEGRGERSAQRQQ